MNKKKIGFSTNLLAFLGFPLVSGLFLYFVRADFRILIPLAVGLPAFLIALTSLLLNRARAWPPGPIQRRSLFAAEILLRALYLVLLAILSALVITYLIPTEFFIGNYFLSDNDSLSLSMKKLYLGMYFYIIPCLFLFFAYVNALLGLKLIIHRRIYVAGANRPKYLIRLMK